METLFESLIKKKEESKVPVMSKEDALRGNIQYINNKIAEAFRTVKPISNNYNKNCIIINIRYGTNKTNESILFDYCLRSYLKNNGFPNILSIQMYHDDRDCLPEYTTVRICWLDPETSQLLEKIL